jgi:osmotically inducible lipoprotein OsmB
VPIHIDHEQTRNITQNSKRRHQMNATKGLVIASLVTAVIGLSGCAGMTHEQRDTAAGAGIGAAAGAVVTGGSALGVVGGAAVGGVVGHEVGRDRNP